MKKIIPAFVVVLAVAVVAVVWWRSRPRSTPRLSMAQQVVPTTSATPANLTGPNAPAFAAWVAMVQANPAILPAQLDEGKRLAEAHRADMLQLMRENPKRALEQSLKWDEWAALPAEIRALVEQPFSATVEFSMKPDCRPLNSRTTPWQTHRVKMDGEWLDAFVFGKRALINAKNGLPVQGVRLGNQVALWDTAVLPLQGPELAAAQNLLPDGNDRTRSWLTGQPINDAPTAALVGGKIHYFANAVEMHEVASVFAEAEAQPGPLNVIEAMAEATSDLDGTFNPKLFTLTLIKTKSVWTETPKRVLLMRMDFTPPSTNPYTPAVMQAEFLSTSNTLREMSYNKTWATNTMVTPLITITNAQSYWETNSTGADGMMDFAKSRLASLGFNVSNYDIFVVSMPNMNRYSGAAAFAGGQNMWINGGPWGNSVPCHELGHNYGYGHANFWRGSTGAGLLGHTNGNGGTLEHQEYGDGFEIMGDSYGSYPQGHFNMQAKALFNWIETNEVSTVSTSGVYRVRRFDHINARQLSGTKLAVLATNAFGDRFWIGYRRAPTNANYAAALTGAYIIWGNEVSSHRLIDTTRLSVPNGTLSQEILDAPLQVGQSWTDPSGSLRITTLAMGGASPNEYLDVAIELNLLSPSYQLFTTSAATTKGLLGSYVNSNLRSRLAQEDWRSTPGVTISGTRLDAAINFANNDWGVRGPTGVTGGSDDDWENFSVQWDGWLQVYRATKFATRSDDSSRMWIDLNGNGSFAATGPEFINNNWGTGQSATVGDLSVTVPPGLYRIRIQYEEGAGDNVCQLVASPIEFDLFTDAAFTTNGLTGSYVNANLRGYAPQDDWRNSQSISGQRRDAYPLYLQNNFGSVGWGNRTEVGITGGSGEDWDNFSVQWDGWIRVYVPTRLASLSDDSSRMWLDLNGNAAFATNAPEFINNHWGSGQTDVYGETSAIVNPGTYRIRIQYEEGAGGNHLALFGAPQETTPPAGYSLYFDGVDDYVSVPNAGTSMPTNEITIEFWQRTYEVKNASTFCMFPDQLTNRVNGHAPWGDGKVYWDFGDYTGAGRLSYTPASIVGTWQHFAFVSSRAGNFQRIYRNGVLEASDSSSQSFVRYAAALRLGNNEYGQAFHGELDEFRIWSVARTQAEIQNNMGSGMATNQPNLWAYWRFDEGAGTTVTDLSGNGRNGTILNGAQWVVSSLPRVLVAPEIAVFTGATTNAASSRTNRVGVQVFADTVPGYSTPQVFTIKNMGTTNLTGLALGKTGVNMNDFSVSALGATTLAPQATTTFTITFAPSAAGARYAAVDITSTDDNENPFSIIVSGTGATPAITGQPSNTVACVGSAAKFSVIATPGSVTYQWQKRAAGTAAFTNIPGATAASYVTPSVTAGDDGAGFRVIVAPGANSVTSTEAMLSVITLTSPTATFDFTSGNLGGGNIYGDAAVSNNALVLTPAVAGKSGAFLTPALVPAEQVEGFTAQFKLQIAAGNGYADGFSFNWATDLPSGVFTNAEEGAGSGLRVGFDTYNNGGADGPAIEVRWGTNLIASYLTNNGFLPGTNDFADVAIRLHADGTLDVTYRCVPIFSRLPIPGYTPLVGARFGLGARTGGFYEAHIIDDLALELDVVVPILEASIPGDPVTGTSGNYPPYESPSKAIDNDVSSKYFNGDKLNAGLTITPHGQRPVRALTLISANDVPARDPGSFLLEGSTDGINFTRLASNAVPLFPARHSIQSFPVANSSVYSQYRLRFPTVANPATADAVQIAEVELLYNEELTSTNDLVSITLPPGASDVWGVGSLFDRQLDGSRKLEVSPINNGSTVVDLTLAAGPKVLKGFEIIGAADDFSFPERRPSSVSVAGSNDGTNYTHLGIVIPAPPLSNMQIQEFAAASNNLAFARYRITFGPPTSGNILQVGEMRIFGEPAPLTPEITVYTGDTTNAAALTNGGGYAFLTTTIGEARTATFTIQNLGQTNLTGLALSITGPAASDYNLSPLNMSNLAVNATVTFSVDFEPAAAGTRAASIWIASNDPDENPFEIKVSGTGTTNAALAEASIPGDPVTATSTNFPAAQSPDKAIDNNVTTKYLNFDKLNTGLTITPLGRQPVRALALISAEDAPERDPSSFVFEGSNNGTNFTRIASNAVPAFLARNAIQSFGVDNTNVFNQYRVLFPTVSNAATANSMQIAEVELLYSPEISSPNDAVSITLPPGAVDVRGVGMLFDRQLGLTRKLEVAPITNANTIVNLTPIAGATVLKSFELIGAADDFSNPGRRPSSVTVAGSSDGTNYTDISSVVPAAPSSNLQIQEFATASNAMAFAQYRITFGPPVSGNRLQVGEMRLFGEVANVISPVLSIRATGNDVLVSWTNTPGFTLEAKTSLSVPTWSPVGITPVLSNGVNTVTIPINGDASFFRLHK